MGETKNNWLPARAQLGPEPLPLCSTVVKRRSGFLHCQYQALHLPLLFLDLSTYQTMEEAPIKADTINDAALYMSHNCEDDLKAT